MKTESTLRPHERDNDLHLTLGLYQLRVLETALHYEDRINFTPA
nr:MAG TPA: hypothetical protein [Caudoviricetes sp.]